MTLNPEIIKTETKYYKLNHYSESKSKTDSTVDQRERNWDINVTNTIIKSYDSWDEIDANNNIIKKGDEFNVKADSYISNGTRQRSNFQQCPII